MIIAEVVYYAIVVLIILFLIRFVEDHGGSEFYSRHFGKDRPITPAV